MRASWFTLGLSLGNERSNYRRKSMEDDSNNLCEHSKIRGAEISNFHRSLIAEKSFSNTPHGSAFSFASSCQFPSFPVLEFRARSTTAGGRVRGCREAAEVACARTQFVVRHCRRPWSRWQRGESIDNEIKRARGGERRKYDPSFHSLWESGFENANSLQPSFRPFVRVGEIAGEWGR